MPAVTRTLTPPGVIGEEKEDEEDEEDEEEKTEEEEEEEEEEEGCGEETKLYASLHTERVYICAYASPNSSSTAASSIPIKGLNKLGTGSCIAMGGPNHARGSALAMPGTVRMYVANSRCDRRSNGLMKERGW